MGAFILKCLYCCNSSESHLNSSTYHAAKQALAADIVIAMRATGGRGFGRMDSFGLAQKSPMPGAANTVTAFSYHTHHP